MIQFRLGEWQLILHAYAYEVLDNPIASDNTYDIISKCVAESESDIPNFDPSTGMWIHDVLKIFPEELIKEACLQLIKMEEGSSCTHVIKPEWIKTPL